MHADSAKEHKLQVTVASDVHDMWQSALAQDPKVKLDDLGDALHSVTFCVVRQSTGSSSAVPSSVSLHNNRSCIYTLFRIVMQ